jgi:hypothetical protein|tara:strand:+ start:982 stop:2052 length:1071 start_codon:yes stop_codon:yes gene_type:complete
MASTFTSRFKLEKMETGANANTWGTRTNNNLDVLDAFGGGYLAKSVAGSSNITLSTADADPTAESSNKIIELTGALTGDIVVFVPATEGEYVFFNNTSGSQTLTIAATGHTANGIAIAQGAYSHIYNDGSANFKMYNAVDKLGALTIASGQNLTAGGGNITLRSNGQVQATLFTGSGAGLTGVEPFASGTKMVFYQASAPTGWTQDTATALSDAAFRVTTGTGAGTGGSDTFQTTFAASRSLQSGAIPVSGSVSVSGSVGSHTLSTPEIASHSHTMTVRNPANPNNNGSMSGVTGGTFSGTRNPSDSTANAGGGGGHTHPFSVSSASLSSAATADTALTIPAMNIKFANVIVAAKD